MPDENRLTQLLKEWRQNAKEGRFLSGAEMCPDDPEMAQELERRLLGPSSVNLQNPKPPADTSGTVVLDSTDTGSKEILPNANQDKGPGTVALAPDIGDWSGLDSVAMPVSPAIPATILIDPSEEGKSSAPATVWPTIQGYEILSLLGEGGMGAVYKARDKKLDRLVALKVINEQSTGKNREARFHVEAQAVARLQHPHIVQIFDLGEWQASEKAPPLPYLALEYIEGGTLEGAAGTEPMDPREAARIVMFLAKAMQQAHSRGIIHRDLKPGNVLMAPPTDEPALNSSLGCPKITDFGLARQSQLQLRLTQTGAIMGTPTYMSPEQAEGQHVGPSADIYALGAILYRLLTGKVLFPGDSPLEVLVFVTSKQPTPPRELVPQVPAELEAICLKCLSKKPEGRYPTAGSLAAELEHYLQGPPVVAAPPPPVQAMPTPPAPVAQQPAQKRGGCAGMILSIGGMAFALVTLIVWLIK